MTPARDDGGLAALLEAHGDLGARELLEVAIREVFPERIALVSSFGAEAAVLLHLVASVDARLPVIFMDTRKLFGETLRYRDQLVERLGLRDVRTVRPDAAKIAALDPDGMLWRRAPDSCCALRKTEPLERALEGFDAWITGRKRFHGETRDQLDAIELVEGRFKVNPLAGWAKADLDAYFEAHDLPRHPLEADGFLSIGCMPCTDRVAPGENLRDGRWRGREKTECGIHQPFEMSAQGLPGTQA